MRVQPAVVVASAALLVTAAVLVTVLVMGLASSGYTGSTRDETPDPVISTAADDDEVLARMSTWSGWVSRPGLAGDLMEYCAESGGHTGTCVRRHTWSLDAIVRLGKEVSQAGGQVLRRAGYECFPEVPAFSTFFSMEQCLTAVLSGEPAQSARDGVSPVSAQSARAYLSRIRGGIGSPLVDVLSQMPDDMTPDIDLRGEDRVFTYTFGDGSEMILVFRPSGNQTGLELYMVDVRDR